MFCTRVQACIVYLRARTLCLCTNVRTVIFPTTRVLETLDFSIHMALWQHTWPLIGYEKLMGAMQSLAFVRPNISLFDHCALPSSDTLLPKFEKVKNLLMN